MSTACSERFFHYYVSSILIPLQALEGMSYALSACTGRLESPLFRLICVGDEVSFGETFGSGFRIPT